MGRESPRVTLPLLCKEGRGEVESREVYPTWPPLTKGRDHLVMEPALPLVARNENVEAHIDRLRHPII